MFSGTKGYRTKPPVGVRLNPLHPLSQGLVGCWLFNEGAGSVAHDISGHGNHGMLMNMAPNAQDSGWGGSKFGGGLNFDGTDDHVDLGTSQVLQPQIITVAMWVKREDSWAGQENMFLFAKGNWWDPGVYLTCMETKPVVMVVDGANYFYYSGVANDLYPLNEWVHIVVSFDSITNNKAIYVNGVSLPVSIYGTPDSITGTNDIKYIGTGLGNDFDGQISHVHLYNRALSAYEVKQLHEDPFCNLLRVPVRYAPAAPGGLSIPVAMNYYRRRRIA